MIFVKIHTKDQAIGGNVLQKYVLAFSIVLKLVKLTW